MAGIRIQIRRDTTVNWTSVNPVLRNGEFGYETDTGYIKVGDGITAWVTLPYRLGVTTTTNNYTSSITGGNMASLAGYANMAAALTAIGSTPTTLLFDTDSTVSTALTIPANVKLLHTNGAKFIKSGSGTIAFAGIGLEDPESRVPIFSGFGAGDVTWTSSNAYERPAAVSTELWDTGTASLSDRLIRANAAFGSKQVKIICYPRVSTIPVDFDDNKEIYFTPGDYTNTRSWPGSGAIHNFGLGNNTYFHGPRNAKLYESTGTYGCRIVEPVSMSLNYTNIVVEGLSFVGDPAATGDGSGSTVILGDAWNSAIRYCYFDAVHNYATILGGFGGGGHYAYNSEIVGNVYTKAGVQTISLINGKNLRILNNWLDATDGVAGGAIIDIEPNSPADLMEGIVIDGNTILASDAFTGSNIVSGITVQAAGAVSEVRGVVVRNNNFIGANPETYPSNTRMATGIGLKGVTDFTVENNTTRWTSQTSLDISNCRNGKFANNHVLAGGDVSGFGSPIHIGSSANIIVEGNTLQQVEGDNSIFIVNYSILEYPERQWGSATGSTITKLQGGFPRFYRFNNGQQVFYNGSLYTILSVDTALQVLTLTSSVGTVIEQSFAAAAVTTATDQIAITAHGYQTGAIVTPTSTGTLPSGIPGTPFPSVDGGVYVYVIRVDANNIKLATTLANALAGTAIDLTTQGTGTHTLHPVIEPRFSNNIFRQNDASGGIILEPTGTSQITSSARDNFMTTVADVDYTATNGSGVIVYTSLTAGRTVNLPDATKCRGKAIVVKDGAGGAAAHNITLDGNGAQTIDGSATKVISTNYGSLKVQSDGANWITL